MTQASPNVHWMGTVPSHWEVKALKFCAELITERVDGTTAGTSTYIGLEHIQGKTGRLVRTKGSQDSAESTVSCFQAGDVLFGKLRPYLAKATAVESAGVCSSEILVYRPHALTAAYLKHVMLLSGFIEEVTSSTYGSKMPRADAAFISRLPVPQPPVEEQHVIARYLDTETARIDGLIEEKQRLLGVLIELRASVMGEAIQNGLKPDVELIETGVPWLGRVPRHWEVMRLKHLLDRIEQGWSPQCDGRQADAHEWGVLKAGACNGGKFHPEENKALPAGMEGDKSIEVMPGDVLMSRASGSIDLVGSVAHVEEVRSGLMLSDKIFRLRLDASRGTSGKWLAMVFNTPSQRRQIASHVGGAEGLARNITSTSIKELWLAVPPPDEQEAIVGFLSARVAQIDDLVRLVEAEVSMLQELRSATTTDAVLGRIDVRDHMKIE